MRGKDLGGIWIWNVRDDGQWQTGDGKAADQCNECASHRRSLLFRGRRTDYMAILF